MDRLERELSQALVDTIKATIAVRRTKYQPPPSLRGLLIPKLEEVS